MNVKDKVALVLGAIKGIGKGIALSLAQAEAKVALTYFDWHEELAVLKEDLAAAGGDHLVLKANLLETEAIPAMMDTVIERFGRLDILINNIERGDWPVVHGQYDRQQWDLEMETTLRTKRWVFEAALPHLKSAGDAIVINFSSIAGIVGRSGPAGPVFNEGYAAANRGVSLLTETWARMGAPQVRVNEIMLGFFETRHAQETRGWGLLSAQQKKAILDHTLLARTGAIEDIVKTVNFVIKDAPFMTGSVIRLDGGYVLGGDKVDQLPVGIL